MACGLAKVHTVAHNLPVRCACLSMPTALPTALVQPATVRACSTRGSSPAAAAGGKGTSAEGTQAQWPQEHQEPVALGRLRQAGSRQTCGHSPGRGRRLEGWQGRLPGCCSVDASLHRIYRRYVGKPINLQPAVTASLVQDGSECVMRQSSSVPLQVAARANHARACGSATVETTRVGHMRMECTASMSLAYVVGQQLLILGGMCRACVCSGL
jgi:hypothetical protein